MRTLVLSVASAALAITMIAAPAYAANTSSTGTADANTATKASTPTPPDVVVKQTINKLLKRMDGHRDELRKHPKQLYQLVDQVLIPAIDVDFMARLVLGQAWRKATPEQRKRFIRAFKVMVVRTYGNALLEFNKDTIEFKPLRGKPQGKRVTIQATVNTNSGSKIPVSLSMHLTDGQWKAYNGTVGSLSIVTNYRGQFRQAIQHGGLKKLIQRLEQRYQLSDS